MCGVHSDALNAFVLNDTVIQSRGHLYKVCTTKTWVFGPTIHTVYASFQIRSMFLTDHPFPRSVHTLLMPAMYLMFLLVHPLRNMTFVLKIQQGRSQYSDVPNKRDGVISWGGLR